MMFKRHQNSSTGINQSALIDALNDSSCEQLILYASASTPTADFSQSDGHENNLPLVAAIAKYSAPETYVVYDGALLSAARQPRSGEVRDLLDIAQVSGKAAFFFGEVPFTSSRQPEEAVRLLLSFGPLTALTPATRARYFSLLSSLPESEHF